MKFKERMTALRKMLKQKRIGFQIDEVMSGEHEFEKGSGPGGPTGAATARKRPMEFVVTWGPRHVSSWLNPFGLEFMSQPLSGTVTIDGLCDKAPCSGTLDLAYFSEAKIRYEFDFEVKGKKYHFLGEKKDLRPWNLLRTHTTCYGILTEKAMDRIVSRSITYFRMKTLPAFLCSARLA